MMRAGQTVLWFLLGWTAAVAQTLPVPLPKDLGGAGPPAADAVVPPELAALRARYAVSLSTADRAVTGQWMTTMAALEKARAAAGDYEGAARMRARREESLVLMGTDDGRLTVRLTVKEVTGKGSGLTIGETGGTATLSSNGAFLEWDVSGEFKGWYDIMLTHGVGGGRGDHTAEVTPITGPRPPAERSESDSYPPLAGGWASFQNLSSLNRNETVLRRQIVSTGGWNAWRRVSLGRMELNGRLARLRLTVEDPAKEGVMQFRQLELVPSTAPGAKGAAEKLKLARDEFVKDFRNLAVAANRKYRAGLDALELQATRSKDTDTLIHVRNEKDALTNSPEALALSSPSGGASRSAPIKLEVTNSFNCTVRGEIRPDKDRTALTMLRPVGSATITWRLLAFNVGSGVYQVEIKGRVPVNGGGTGTLAAFGASSTPAGKALGFKIDPVVKPEARGKKLESGESPPSAQGLALDAGHVVIGKGAETLTLTVTGLTHSDGSLMDLRSLTLTRTGDVPPVKPAP